jgi:Integrase core domain
MAAGTESWGGRNAAWISPARSSIMLQGSRNGPTCAPTPRDADRNRACTGWFHGYNHHRSHSALGGRPPISRATNLPAHYIKSFLGTLKRDLVNRHREDSCAWDRRT